MDTSLFPTPELFAVVKVHLQALGVEIDKDYTSSTPKTVNIQRQWRVGSPVQLRVLAGVVGTNPLAHGIAIQSPSGNPLVSCIFKLDYDTELTIHQLTKLGTAWEIPHANSLMDALFMIHRMRDVGGAYVREHVIPNLGKGVIS